MKELTEKEVLQKAAAYCSGAEHCRSDVMHKLSLWGTDPASARQIIEYLQKKNILMKKDIVVLSYTTNFFTTNGESTKSAWHSVKNNWMRTQ